MENYKQYKNSDYDIYIDGKCYSHKSKKFLTPQMTSRYPTYNLTLPDGKRKVKVHRMVAETFIDNPDNKPIINHKDGNTHNFNIDNLEWATYSENSAHATKTGLRTIGDQTPVLYTTDLENELWKEIKEYPNYMVSSKGRVMNKQTRRLLRPASSNIGGYYEVNLWRNNTHKVHRIHKLVYCAFNDDYNLEGYVINHIDGNKQNNDVENLEKVNYQENNEHAVYIIKTNQYIKTIGQYTLNDELVKIFPPLQEQLKKLKFIIFHVQQDKELQLVAINGNIYNK